MTYPYVHQPIETVVENYCVSHKIEVSLEKKELLIDIIHKTIQFNLNLQWDSTIKGVRLATTPEVLLDIYLLRSKIYKKMHYHLEFPDSIEGLNFDIYDGTSAVMYTYSQDGMITGTCRIIFDSERKLPLDKNFSLDYLRDRGENIAELSRLMIDKKAKTLSQEPRLLTKSAYLIMKDNTMTTLVSVMVEEHYQFYKKFGGFSIEDSLATYGNIGIPFIVTAWEVSKISKFFEKVFLSNS